ncbi:Fe2+ or Zn2+ uptake regulation protein Fur/Zur [Pontibacter korlensis]|uniref:Transcriptional regulator n=1 Tax=Pontibacter korlensis TaxID=400092 RepID=A0A0E3UWU5_9BACT|nr:transcriptional regulator [Pontibacter korlensis]
MTKRNTKAKQLILNLLKAAKSALSQDILQAQLGDAVDRVTIYRVLNSFLEDGVVHKIVGDDGKQYFACCKNCSDKKYQHNHFHFRCISCGKIECLPNEVEVKLPKAYRTLNFNGVVSGYCSNC